MTFARKPYPKPPRVPATPIPRDVAERISYGQARLNVAPKSQPIQHRGYMDVVRSLHCIRCYYPPRSQFCHGDILGKGGKGFALKSDCRLGYPCCQKCHYDIGTARVLPKQERHEWEAEAARQTRQTINAMGLWPASLPQWPEDTE